MATIQATVAAAEGLHARPAAMFAKAVSESGADVQIATGDSEPVNAASTLSLMTLGAQCGDVVTLTCEGDNADNILTKLKEHLEQSNS
ncbi:MAG: HPr family phosphocarrier protein [Actinomycetaceae bacterium]|nr:HPr family phosphocarrier protein [Actinomycetaceae bacterium]